MNANQKIKAAQRERERWVIARIRDSRKAGRRWRPDALTDSVTVHAVERLEARGRIRWNRNRRWEYSGYEEVA